MVKCGRVRGGGNCVSAHRLVLRVKQPKRGRIVRVAAFVNGRRMAIVRGRRISRVVLTRLPRGAFTVKLVATSSAGRRKVSVRRYRNCG